MIGGETFKVADLMQSLIVAIVSILAIIYGVVLVAGYLVKDK